MPLKAFLHVVGEGLLPLLEKKDEGSAVRNQERLTRHLELIDACKWSSHTDVALDEARRVFDAEMVRRASADTKATTYLAVVAALVPIALTVQSAVVERKIGAAPSWVNLLFLATGMLYVLGAGLWSFRVLKVSGAARADVPDLLHAWGKPDPRIHIVRTTIKAARLNWAGVNEKVTFIRMAHEYLMRAFIAFTLLVVVNAGWTLIQNALPVGGGSKKPEPAEQKRHDEPKTRHQLPLPARRNQTAQPPDTRRDIDRRVPPRQLPISSRVTPREGTKKTAAMRTEQPPE